MDRTDEQDNNRTWRAVLDRALATRADASRVPTGFHELDDMIGGYGVGTLSLICGEPGVGTSTLLLDTLRHTAFQRGESALYYCADRSERAIVVQIIAAQSKVRWHTVAHGPNELDEAQSWDRAMQWSNQHQLAPLQIVASPWLNVDALIDDIEYRCRARTPRLIAVDPLIGFERALRVNDAVIDTARLLKAAALRLDVPIVATAGCTIAEFDPSFDTLARVADTVLSLYRADLHDPEDPRCGEADLTVFKSRTGRTGTFTLVSLLKYGFFAEMTPMG